MLGMALIITSNMLLINNSVVLSLESHLPLHEVRLLGSHTAIPVQPSAKAKS